ncbi:hypothetical protein BJ508DRAFT_161550 [Ascobolus immersus RN42]|uniref:Uncharacterized protein n=1 Tax=Ascobolus immersus RN42 TaxID=1160509 RepID=A0A3N4HWH2_ASCIM|nr:hypothetical protein BJ508DRAFT_161550 [Ascobolus immersus RN42]
MSDTGGFDTIHHDTSGSSHHHSSTMPGGLDAIHHSSDDLSHHHSSTLPGSFDVVRDDDEDESHYRSSSSMSDAARFDKARHDGKTSSHLQLEPLQEIPGTTYDTVQHDPVSTKEKPVPVMDKAPSAVHAPEGVPVGPLEPVDRSQKTVGLAPVQLNAGPAHGTGSVAGTNYHYDEDLTGPLNGFMQKLQTTNTLQPSLEPSETRQTDAPTPLFDEPQTGSAMSSTHTTPLEAVSHRVVPERKLVNPVVQPARTVVQPVRPVAQQRHEPPARTDASVKFKETKGDWFRRFILKKSPLIEATDVAVKNAWRFRYALKSLLSQSRQVAKYLIKLVEDIEEFSEAERRDICLYAGSADIHEAEPIRIAHFREEERIQKLGGKEAEMRRMWETPGQQLRQLITRYREIEGLQESVEKDIETLSTFHDERAGKIAGTRAKIFDMDIAMSAEDQAMVQLVHRYFDAEGFLTSPDIRGPLRALKRLMKHIEDMDRLGENTKTKIKEEAIKFNKTKKDKSGQQMPGFHFKNMFNLEAKNTTD